MREALRVKTPSPMTFHRPFPGCSITSGDGSLEHAALSDDERALHQTLAPARSARWVRGRRAARDALVQVLGSPLPATTSILRDPQGAPEVHGLRGMHLSIAHSGERSAALASASAPVAIDFERITDRTPFFEERAFTPEERVWLDTQPLRAEAATRLWAAREVAAKLSGQGLQGQPRRWALSEACGETLFICGVPVTTQVFEHHVLAWSHGEGVLS